MRTRHFVRSLLVLMLILLPATPALANSLASWVRIWPGVVSIDSLFGLLPTVLVSFVERPFVSRAGVEKRPLLRSIRANLLSLLAGIPIAAFVWGVESELGLVALAVVSVAVTIVVETAYFRSVLCKESKELRWAWIVVGNFVSNLVLVGLAIIVRTIQEWYPQIALAPLPYQGVLILLHIGISLTAVTAAIAEPTMHAVRLLFASGKPETGENLDTTAEPEHPADGSQPFRLVVKSTSVAAGSRR